MDMRQSADRRRFARRIVPDLVAALVLLASLASPAAYAQARFPVDARRETTVVEEDSPSFWQPTLDEEVIPDDGGAIVLKDDGATRRGTWLAVMVVAFVIAMMAALGRQGWRTALSIGVAGALIVFVLAPLAKRGVSPLLLVWPIAAVICGVSIRLIAGRSRKALHAMGGAVAAISLAAWLPILLGRTLSLTGLDVGFGTRFHVDVALWYAPPLAKVDFGELLIAGMILAGLGAVMDIAMTVASAVAEVRRAAPGATRDVLAPAGLNVGRAVLGISAVSVVLIMVGDVFHRLLMYHVGGLAAGAGRLLNHEAIAADAVRMVSCVVAMIAAIPFTVLFANLFPGRRADDGHAGEPLQARPRPGVLAWATTGAMAAAVLIAALAVGRGTHAWYHGLSPRTERVRNLPDAKVQRALGQVARIQAPAIDPAHEPLRTNPGRGPADLREQPVVLTMLTGEHRGELVLATNTLAFLPTHRARLAPGARADVMVKSREGVVADVTVLRPAVRFPAVLACVGVTASVVILLLGVRGAALAAALGLNLALISANLRFSASRSSSAPSSKGSRSAASKIVGRNFIGRSFRVRSKGSWYYPFTALVAGTTYPARGLQSRSSIMPP